MESKQLKQLVRRYHDYEDQLHPLWLNVTKDSTALKQITEITTQMQLIAEEIYSDCKCQVEIQDAYTIVGSRATTEGMHQKLSIHSCNVLTKIMLSGKIEVGNIRTPYKFKLDGTAVLTDDEHEYKIKRDGSTVYWVIGSKKELYI